MPSKPKTPSKQTSLLDLPTEDPAAAIIWETRTTTWKTREANETWEFYKAKTKGHTFHVGCLPTGILAQSQEPAPSKWTDAHWQLHTDFEPGGNMELMSSLIGAHTKDEALRLAEERIRDFLLQKRAQYD